MDILKLKKGDPDAFEQFVREYEKKVYNIALRLLSDYDLAYDASQEVFVKVYKNISAFKEECALSTWVYRITVNVCTDIHRKNNKEKAISIDDDTKEGADLLSIIPDAAPTPEEVYCQKESNVLIKKAISRLPSKYKEVIILRELQNLSYHEISSILDCSEGTVKSRINRGREKLYELLSKCGNFFCNISSK